MKTLTYGTLPSYFDFNQAFAVITPNGVYALRLSDSDARMFEATGVGPYDTQYNCQRLYALCEALVWEIERPVEVTAEGEESWAGDFCSSILATLGFEWI
jgi:hypothetical protein